MLRKLIVTAVLTAALSPLFAQETPATEPVKEEKKPLIISGFVDAYYRYDFSKNPSNNRTSFTNSHNSFELGMASVKLEHSIGKVGFVADLGFGKRAQEFSYNDNGITQAIKQLYVTYSPKDWLKFTMGSWATHVGYELVDAPANRNYSMSYMFSWGPFFHTGIKAEATAGKSGFMLGISNQTDYKWSPPGAKKFILAQYSLAATDKIKLYLNYVGGQTADSIKVRQLDMVATATLTDKFSVGFNGTVQSKKTVTQDALAAKEDFKNWWGTAAYLNFDPSSTVGFTFRSEIHNDKNQLGGMSIAPMGASVWANTLSANFKAGPLTFIPEIRFESASKEIFADKDGAALKSNTSALIAAIYKF
ncbi:MAG: outer membrane beta-barrel protein [Sphingobacteriales bacterium]